jgi:hypothetical protein
MGRYGLKMVRILTFDQMADSRGGRHNQPSTLFMILLILKSVCIREIYYFTIISTLPHCNILSETTECLLFSKLNFMA